MINFLLIIIVLIGGSALIKFAIQLFWLLLKLAILLGVLFFAFQAVSCDDMPYSTPQEQHAPVDYDTIKELNTKTLMNAELVLL